MSEEKKWYSLRVISGKERKIKERIELEIHRSKWEDAVTQVLVPTEKVYKIRNGKKVISERNILPGYILVEAVPKRFPEKLSRLLLTFRMLFISWVRQIQSPCASPKLIGCWVKWMNRKIWVSH